MASIFNWPDARPDLDLFGEQVQQRLAWWNQARLQPRLPDDDWEQTLNRDHAMQELEGSFLESLREQVDAAVAAVVPTEPKAFIREPCKQGVMLARARPFQAFVPGDKRFGLCRHFSSNSSTDLRT